MKTIRGALVLSWKYLVLTVIIVGILCLVAHLSNFTVALDIVRIFVGAKAALASILMASVIFYYRFIWDDIERVTLLEYPIVVEQSAGTLCLLFGSVALLIISVAADAYTIYIHIFNWVIRISSICSAVALLYLLIFVIWLAIQTLGRMETLRKVGELAKQDKKEKQE